jgi:nucleotide-binding universal stress UspA family protein
VTSTGYERGCDGPSALVVGVDGSDTSWRALYYAFGLARRQRSTVIAVFVIVTIGGYASMAVAPCQVNADLAEELERAVVTLAAEYGVATKFLSLVGDPVSTLIRVATAEHADALVLGASQALGHRLFGSVALRAVRRCRCPVTVVP